MCLCVSMCLCLCVSMCLCLCICVGGCTPHTDCREPVCSSLVCALSSWRSLRTWLQRNKWNKSSTLQSLPAPSSRLSNSLVETNVSWGVACTQHTQADTRISCCCLFCTFHSQVLCARDCSVLQLRPWRKCEAACLPGGHKTRLTMR